MYRILMFGLLLACQQLAAQELSEDSLDALLKVRGVESLAPEEKEKLKTNLRKKSKVAQAIYAEQLVNVNEVDALVNEYRSDLLIKTYFDQYLKNTVTKQAVKEYYQSHLNEFQKKEVKIAHIYIKSSNPNKKQLKKEIAQQIKDGDDFSMLVRTYSEDVLTAKKDGELGWVPEGYINKKFSQAIFSLKQGEVSGEIRSSAGVHFVKVLEAPRDHTYPFDQVKAKIRAQLEEQAKQQELNRLKKL